MRWIVAALLGAALIVTGIALGQSWLGGEEPVRTSVVEDEDDDEEDEEEESEDDEEEDEEKDEADEEESAASESEPGVVAAAAETQPVPHSGDAADDPAIWVHPTRADLSLVLGTDKQGGLAVYDLAGKQLQYVSGAQPNNVDVRGNLAAASDRSRDSIALYRIDPRSRRIVPAGRIETGIAVYGACLYRSAEGPLYAFVTSKEGEVEQWRIDGGRRLVRRLDVGSQTEGCVADDERSRLYLAEEGRGIWRYGAEPTAGERRTLVDAVGSGRLEADVEGLAVAGEFLVASSQGSDSFAVYRREDPNRFIGSFSVEGVEETDGIDLRTEGFGSRFPDGLLVVQDGQRDGNQNFKLVRWAAVLER